MSGATPHTDVTGTNSLTGKVINAGAEFLMHLFADTEHDIEIRCLPSRKQFFSTNLTEIDTFIKDNIGSQNIYYGCCTREDRKGTKQACRELVALWLDLDFKGLAGGQADADRIIEEMIPPSVIIHTGNGYHINWLLREPADANEALIESYTNGLANHYNGDSGATDLARVLRVPGTFNYKDGKKKPVSIIKADYGLRYNLSDFDDLVGKTANTEKATAPNDSMDDISEGQRNSTLTSLAGTMRRRGMTELEISAALHAINKNRCRPPLSDSEVESIAKSISRYEKEHKPAWDQGLVDLYGEPYYLSKNENPEVTTINEGYWAGRYDNEHIILYEPLEKVFYEYNDINGLYEEISLDIIKQRIGKRILETSRQDNLPSLEKKKTNTTLNAVIGQLKGITEKRDIFRRDRRIVHLANGVLVFERGDADLYEFSPDFYSRNQSPISFDSSAKCDRFLNELLYPAVSPDDAVIVQKYAGMAMLGRNLIQRLLILDGLAGRGKTQLALVTQKIVGQQNVTELRTKHLSDRFELFKYLKKTLLVGVDTPGNFLSEKGAYVIKGLVGGDCFDAEQKGGTGCFPFQGEFCILITSNSRLQVKLDGDIGAWRRRLLIIRYEAPPPEKKIPNFADVLILEEGSGILNWMLHGLAMLLVDIEEHGDIRLSESQQTRIDSLLAESDSLRMFLEQSIEQRDHTDISVSEIVEAYAKYCPTQGWNPKAITLIYRDLDGLMLEKFGRVKAHDIIRAGKSARGYRNICFKKGVEDE